MNNGSLLTTYIGHASVEIWANNVFSSPDAMALTNGNRLPVVVALNCLNGYFHDVYTLSLAEALMKAPNGGAVAVWASSTLTQPDQQALMGQELFSQLFRTREPDARPGCGAREVRRHRSRRSQVVDSLRRSDDETPLTVEGCRQGQLLYLI